MALFEIKSLETDLVVTVPAESHEEAWGKANELIKGFFTIETIREDDNRWNKVRYE